MERTKFQERRKQMANIARFDPFNELVDDLFKAFWCVPSRWKGAPSCPHEGRRGEKNGAYVVTAEVPGVRKEDIQVTIDGAQVTLSADVKRRRKSRRTSACSTRARVRQGHAQLHAAAGSGRGEGRGQVPRRRARADAAEETAAGASRSASSKSYPQQSLAGPANRGPLFVECPGMNALSPQPQPRRRRAS